MKVRNHFKIIAGLSLALTMGFSTLASAAQTPTDVNVYQIPMHFTFDGKEYAPPEGQQGFIYEGTTYVPIRFISYSLDKAVSWDPATYTVTIAEPKASEKININEYKINAQVYTKSEEKLDKSKLALSNLTVYKEKISYVFDGVTKSPSDELPGYIVDGSLYVPIRFFSESVGKTINWDPVTYTVSATTTEVKKDDEKLPETTKPGTTAPVAGGGGGGGVTKPTFESIKAETDSRVSALRSKAASELLDLYAKYLSTHDESLKSQGWAVIAQTDSQFAQIMSDMRAKLVANAYDTSIITTYEADYESEKAAQEKALRSK
ncbi:hypothetical protein A8709_23020 [Paenibacillus pectinilyticus]|uniref:Copper amine oxidase-like N-terminal domain-containing protein n=1 Tax=Paenibacillus pectinilyticus TaxID=512399 RepID=A0A1C0ZRL9_9BACL|nr:copper amine oxidase N-terminal domain-containing protein [Paenibacillus pectinilyticus]OCT10712.1 hypothetical protein A8709_23020 [Paenibacillus pectinilyticus]